MALTFLKMHQTGFRVPAASSVKIIAFHINLEYGNYNASRDVGRSSTNTHTGSENGSEASDTVRGNLRIRISFEYFHVYGEDNRNYTLVIIQIADIPAHLLYYLLK